ncbi:MAG TPA: cupin domain-containing protein [Rhodospirillales bacterium]|jgi:quercetin dioxygenase-like cupin family protein|nr:cupin domain-containing protein [Rhodospirillales bacterium]HIL77261.1 cupin domain-containing protein [Rhodospirillales bacterium]
MAAEIYTPTKEEIEARVSRFSELQPMSTANDLAWVGQEAMDVFYARKLMPVILDDTKNPFGNQAPIIGAAGSTMFVSIMPPGQGPCLHSHNGTFETFMVLDGTIEYHIGEPVAHVVTLNKWDVLSCPPNVYRGFHNVGKTDAVQLTVITGAGEGRDDVSMPDSIAKKVEKDFGKKVVDAFRSVFSFDPPRSDLS